MNYKKRLRAPFGASIFYTMAGSVRRFFNNIICSTIRDKETRRRIRVVLNSDMLSNLRFIRRDLGVPLRRIRTYVGYRASNLLISVNDKYIYKFALRRDNSDELAMREYRVVNCLGKISPIYVPPVTILKHNGHLVRKYEYIHGVQLRKCTPEWVAAHTDELAPQCARFMYEMGVADPIEIRDLKPSPDAKTGYCYGWTQGDLCDNFLIDTDTARVVAIIDWEDCMFGDFTHQLKGDKEPTIRKFMDRVVIEYDKLFYKKD